MKFITEVIKITGSSLLGASTKTVSQFKKSTLLLIIVQILTCSPLVAQRRQLEQKDVDTWPALSGTKISNDGRYVGYTLRLGKGNPVLTVKAINGSFAVNIPLKIIDYYFTADSHCLLFRAGKDSLGMLSLGQPDIQYLEEVASFTVPQKGSGQFIAYQLKNKPETLMIRDMFNGKSTSYKNIRKYKFTQNGTYLITYTADTINNLPASILKWTNLPNKESQIIAEGNEKYSFWLDKDDAQLLFIRESNAAENTTLNYYKPGGTVTTLIKDSTPGMEGMKLDGGSFRDDGLSIEFFVTPKSLAGWGKNDVHTATGLQDKPQASLDIWNYKDKTFKSVEPRRWPGVRINGEPTFYSGFVGLVPPHRVFVNSHTISDRYLNDGPGNARYQLVVKDNDYHEPGVVSYVEDQSPFKDVYLYSVSDSTKIKIIKNLPYNFLRNGIYLAGNYVLWYDEDKAQWMSYNVKSQTTRAITRTVHSLFYEDNNNEGLTARAVGIAGFLPASNEVLIYDRFDIWKVDLNGSRRPVNMTGYYGGKHRVQFRLLDYNDNKDAQVMRATDTLMLTAFSLKTKAKGYFLKVLDQHGAPELLSMGQFWSPVAGTVKAGNAGIYVFSKMTATAYPNLVATSDFKTFERLTDLSPQKEINWYSTELVHYPLANGTLAEGYLFKPQNFNPHKRYPVIFYYYEEVDHLLNTYIRPQLMDGPINVPWFTSRDYLVFWPSIHFKMNRIGQSALDYVTSGAKYLSKQPWINPKAMGLQGHSFGGYETNYIVSHSKLFTAAVSAAGIADQISFAEVKRDNSTNWFTFHDSQFRIIDPVWKSPEIYLRNSPLFSVRRVNTPLLLMQNKDDYNTPYQFGINWYIALQRSGKKVWMLQYDKEEHKLENEANQLDYTTRVNQFFDYYLKGSKPPVWMTQGIPNWKKGVDNGLEQDKTDVKP